MSTTHKVQVVIFDTIQPYVYEAFPIMFMPGQASYEARFQLHHVDENFRNAASDSSSRSALRGTSILLCLRSKLYTKSINTSGLGDRTVKTKDEKKGGVPAENLSNDDETVEELDIYFDGSEEKTIITPLRWASIHSVHIIAGIILIRYTLAQPYEYFSESNNSYEDFHWIRKKRDLFCKEIYNSFERKKGAPVSGSEIPHVFELDLPGRAKNEAPHFHLDDDELNDDVDPFSKDWRAAVSLCSCLPYLSGIPFIKFCGFRQIKKPPSNPAFGEGAMAKSVDRIMRRFQRRSRSHFRDQILLKSGATYEFKILEVFPYQLVSSENRNEVCRPARGDFLKRRRYLLALDGNFFTDERRQVAIGGYDFLQFSVPLRPDTHGYVGSIELHFEDYLEDGRNFISPQLSMEYKVAIGSRKISFWSGVFALTILAIITEFGFVQDAKDAALRLNEPLQTIASVAIEGIRQVVYAAGIVGVVSYFVTKLR